MGLFDKMRKEWWDVWKKKENEKYVKMVLVGNWLWVRKIYDFMDDFILLWFEDCVVEIRGGGDCWLDNRGVERWSWFDLGVNVNRRLWLWFVGLGFIGCDKIKKR